MKKIKLTAALISIGAAILASCVSSPKQKISEPSDADEYAAQEEQAGKVVREPKVLGVQNTASEKENEFKALLEDIELKVVSTPGRKAVYSGTAFSAPYVVSVSDRNGPVQDFDITVSWPATRSNDAITFSTARMKTDENGRISFLPGLPSIAVREKITFYPTPATSSPSVVQAAFSCAVTAEYTVKSRYMQYPGGILFVYDYNEKGNPTTNNFALLQNLRNSGVNAGNAPVSDPSYFIRPVSDVYRACVDITQGEIKKAANFLVVGTFKWANPAEENSDGTTVTLKAEFTCLDMKDGSVKYRTSITESATDRTKWNAENACRTALAAKVSEAIIYGM